MAYLYRLAGHAAPATRKPDGFVDPRLLSVMRAVTAPAFVADDLATVVAQNDVHSTLFGRVTGLPGWEGNMFWCWFGSGRWRRPVLNTPAQQEAIGRAYVAYLRVILAQRGCDAAATALVADLRAASVEFSLMWDEHRVSRSHSSTVSGACGANHQTQGDRERLARACEGESVACATDASAASTSTTP